MQLRRHENDGDSRTWPTPVTHSNSIVCRSGDLARILALLMRACGFPSGRANDGHRHPISLRRKTLSFHERPTASLNSACAEDACAATVFEPVMRVKRPGAGALAT